MKLTEPQMSRYLAYFLGNTKYKTFKERDDIREKIQLFMSMWIEDNNMRLEDYGLDGLIAEWKQKV